MNLLKRAGVACALVGVWGRAGDVLRAVRACGLWRWIGGCGGWCCLWVRHYDGV
ncbi:hypothetical protein MNL08_07085 [Bartonella krasnovii]|uniref:hypothetical protein n=1 Tax=Bartonella krasnovii TaxID=2267275 RepID=UPI001F4C841C|nr:hypothetical protein [Bartonella krasnovii]UNF41921.1 hypothetical protein MNL08_07085 [Bartonella krasnovii]